MIELPRTLLHPRGLGILASRFKRKPKPVEQVEVLQPVPTWPRTEVERAVYAALVLAGEPVNNRRLAELMGCHHQ